MSKIPYERSFASHEKSAYWSDKNGDITPRDVYKNSHKRFWFKCKECNHLFQMVLNNIANGNNWCSFCSNQKLCDSEHCNYCFEKSFSSHPKSEFWSNKNGDINPRNVFKKSNKKYWFDCNICKHSFCTTLSEIYYSKIGCSFCANKRLCDDVECKVCFEKSFASHPKCKYWSDKNGDINPRNVFKSSGSKYWFNCYICAHSFEMNLNKSTDRWCSFCSNSPKQLCNDTNCKTCFEKSFASHPKSEFWSDKNGDINPRNVFKSSDKKCWFNCHYCAHVFNSSLYNVTQNNSWCSVCKNKTERKLYDFLLPIYPNIIGQFKQEWCKNKRFDFCIPEHKIIIELDGMQHFKQVMNWTPPEEQFANDKYKEKCANENGYFTIRILQEDVYGDKYDWKKLLCETIEHLKTKTSYSNIYLCQNDEYSAYY